MNKSPKTPRFRIVEPESGHLLGWISRYSEREAKEVMLRIFPNGARLEYRAEDQG